MKIRKLCTFDLKIHRQGKNIKIWKKSYLDNKSFKYVFD